MLIVRSVASARQQNYRRVLQSYRLYCYTGLQAVLSFLLPFI